LVVFANNTLICSFDHANMENLCEVVDNFRVWFFPKYCF
jgi:hypothetical protein